MGVYRLYIHKPQPIFRARINLGAGDTFDSLPVDTITLGDITTPRPGHTLTLGTVEDGDDLGRTRIRAVGDGSTLRIARSSRGTRDGELEVQDNAFVTVWDERRVWAKIPAILPDFTSGGVVIYKDALEVVGDWMNKPPPVANAGTGFAGTIDDTSDLLTVAFDGGDSFAVATGATITGYLWDVGDGAITVGTAATVGITATFPAGFRHVSLTVTDSNDNEHTTFVPVFARDPAADLTVPHELISRRLTPHGQELSVRVTQPLPADEYPDGALVMLWEDEPGSEGDRSHMRFVGWHHHDPSEVEAMRTATLGEVTLECLDAMGKLNTLPGFGQEVRHVPAGEATRWYEMADANMDKYIHYLLYWHSTALEVAPFVWSGTGDTYKLKIVGSEPASLYEQVQRMAQAMVPAHDFTCDSRGRLRVVVDPMLQDIADRTSIVQRAIAASDWSMLRRQHLRPPTVRMLRSGALVASHDQELPVFALSPGFGPGQGASEQDRESQAGLTPSQSVLNSATGHLYARLNAQSGRISVTLTDPGEPGIEPADKSWVNLVIPEDAAGPRGRFGTTRCLPHEVRISYAHTRTGTVVSAEIDLEPETSGVPAQPVFLDVTGVPPPPEDEWWGGEPGDYWEGNFPVVTPTQPFDYGLRTGQQQIAMIQTNGAIVRTSNFLDSPPTWTSLTTLVTHFGTTNFIFSFVVDPFSPGYREGVAGDAINGYAATRFGIWKIHDIFGTPSATLLHTFAKQVQADLGRFRTIGASFGRYFSAETDNPWLMVVTHYGATFDPPNGVTAIFSNDAGQTWSGETVISSEVIGFIANYPVPAPGLYLSPRTPGLAYTCAYSETGVAIGYRTTDWGATWAPTGAIDPFLLLGGSIHVPWPNNDNEGVIYHGRTELFESATETDKYIFQLMRNSTLVSPMHEGVEYGLDGYSTLNRRTSLFGVRTFDGDRRYVALAGVGATSKSETGNRAAVFVSDDHGDSWTRIDGPVAVEAGVDIPMSVAFSADDSATLYIWGAGYIRYTTDFGATVENKKGAISEFPNFIGLVGGPT